MPLGLEEWLSRFVVLSPYKSEARYSKCGVGNKSEGRPCSIFSTRKCHHISTIVTLRRQEDYTILELMSYLKWFYLHYFLA